MTIGLASGIILMSEASAMTTMSGAERVNPLLIESKLPFGAPDFNVINEADYLPAIEAAVKIQRDNIKKIVNSKETPTFANTILPYEESGVLLDRISNVFFGLTSAHKTKVIADTEEKVTPILADLENEITFNPELFKRIKSAQGRRCKTVGSHL